MELKERLAALRRERGLTQDELAQAVGVTRQAVSKWERGVIAPSTVNLVALGQFYGVPLDELANGEQANEKQTAAVAVAEQPEEEPPKKAGLLRLTVSVMLAGCILMTTIISMVLLYHVTTPEPVESKDDSTIIWLEDITPEHIDASEIIDVTEGKITIP